MAQDAAHPSSMLKGKVAHFKKYITIWADHWSHTKSHCNHLFWQARYSYHKSQANYFVHVISYKWLNKTETLQYDYIPIGLAMLSCCSKNKLEPWTKIHRHTLNKTEWPNINFWWLIQSSLKCMRSWGGLKWIPNQKLDASEITCQYLSNVSVPRIQSKQSVPLP